MNLVLRKLNKNWENMINIKGHQLNIRNIKKINKISSDKYRTKDNYKSITKNSLSTKKRHQVFPQLNKMLIKLK